MVVETNKDALNYVPIKVKELINTIYKHPSGCVIILIREIPLVVKLSKKNYLNIYISNSFASSFYDDYGTTFCILFSEFNYLCCEKLEHPDIFTYWSKTFMKRRIRENCKIKC